MNSGEFSTRWALETETMFEGSEVTDSRRQSRAASGRLLLVFTLLLIVGILHGVLAFGCYLINEQRRLSPLEIGLLWLGDVIGLFWFLRFWLRWQFAAPEEFDSSELDFRFPRTAWLIVISMGIGFCSELAMTLSLRHDEYAGFQRAVPATCFLHSVKSQAVQGALAYWKLDGRYKDAQGVSHPVTYYVRDRDDFQLLPGLVVLAIRQGQPNIPLPIIYDPVRPGRSWIPQLGWDDGNRLHYLSLLILLFQFLFSIMFMALLWESIKAHGHLPVWAEYQGLIPLGCQAFIMALFGGLELYIVRRFCP